MTCGRARRSCTASCTDSAQGTFKQVVVRSAGACTGLSRGCPVVVLRLFCGCPAVVLRLFR
eukprot:6220014-Pyramimonas_sp.AAC.1